MMNQGASTAPQTPEEDSTPDARKLGRKMLLSLLLALFVFACLGLYADVSELHRSIAAFPPWRLGAGLLLAFLNYALRYIRWEYYLRHLGIRVSPLHSIVTFAAGLAMTITPGKLGELLKCYVLRSKCGVRVTQTAPIVVAERLTDFLALLLLCIGGVLSTHYGGGVVIAGALLCLCFLTVIAHPPSTRLLFRLIQRTPVLCRFGDRLEEAHRSMASLIRIGPLFWALLLALPAWYLECVAFYIVLGGFADVTATVGEATFIYVLATVAGAITMLPGGLVATEGSMVAMLQEVFVLVPTRGVAVGATLITRVCTLWFAVALGFLALFLFRVSPAGASNIPQPTANSESDSSSGDKINPRGN